MNFGTDNKELLEDIEEFDDNSKPNWINMTRTAMNTSRLVEEQIQEIVFGYIEAKFPELKK
jgi:hypothetical protein